MPAFVRLGVSRRMNFLDLRKWWRASAGGQHHKRTCVNPLVQKWRLHLVCCNLLRDGCGWWGMRALDPTTIRGFVILSSSFERDAAVGLEVRAAFIPQASSLHRLE